MVGEAVTNVPHDIALDEDEASTTRVDTAQSTGIKKFAQGDQQ